MPPMSPQLNTAGGGATGSGATGGAGAGAGGGATGGAGAGGAGGAVTVNVLDRPLTFTL